MHGDNELPDESASTTVRSISMKTDQSVKVASERSATTRTNTGIFFTPRILDLVLYLIETAFAIIICTLSSSLLQLSNTIMLLFATAFFAMLLGFTMVFGSLLRTKVVSIFFNTVVLAEICISYWLVSIMVLFKYSKSPLQHGLYMTIGILGLLAGLVHLCHCFISGVSMDDILSISFQSKDENSGNPRPAPREQVIYDWTLDDLKTLCSRIKDASLRLHKTVSAPYNKTENRLDWESIAFAEHDSEECRTKWQQVCNNIRTYRTMAEIVDDAEQWLQKGPRKAKEAKIMGKPHPDKPNRPATIFFKFMMEQLPKVKAKYPDLHHRQIVSKIGEMYKSITPKKLNQLKADFVKEREAYRARLEEFYNTHPDVAPMKGPVGVAPKGTSGLAFFIAEKMQLPKHANDSKEDLRAKWSKLKDEKKVKYIEMALDAHRKNAGAAHFIAKPSKDVLSKDERIVYDRFLGKPDKPPTTGFALFKSIASTTKYQDLSAVERNKEIQLSWNSMSRPDQNKFNNEVKIFKQQYERKMADYLERLAQREQKLTENAKNSGSNHADNLGLGSLKLDENDAPAAKRAKVETSPTKSPKKPQQLIVKPNHRSKKVSKFSALTWYQESNLPEWKNLNPELTEEELRSAMTEQFSALSDRKKQKWERKAEEENERRGLN